MSTDKYHYLVHVCCQGFIDKQICDYWNLSQIRYNQDGNTCLITCIPDSAAVYGFILFLRDLGPEILYLEIIRKS